MAFKDTLINLILKGKDLLSPATQSAAKGVSELQLESDKLSKNLAQLSKVERNIGNFQRLTTEAGALEIAWKKASLSTEKLKKTMESADEPVEELAKELAQAEKAASKARQAFDRNQKSLSKLAVDLQAAGISQRNMDTEQKKLSKSSSDLRSKLGKVNTQLKQQKADVAGTGAAMRTATKDSGKFSTSMASVGRSIAAFAGAYLSIRGLTASLKGILSTGSDFEKFSAQLNQAMGSIQGGEQATEWIKEFTRQTPFDINTVTESFIKLKAFGLDPMDGTYEALANQAAALGGGQEKLNGIILAVGQAWAKQKLQGEEILQLVERGVPVWDLLADATGRSTVELQKMSQAGQLGRKEISLLINEIQKSTDGALEGQMSTLSGLMSNLGDSWTQFVSSIANSGLQDYVKEQLGTLLDKINELRNNGKLQEWAQGISDGFIRLTAVVKDFTVRTFGDLESFGDKLAGTFEGVGSVINTTGATINLFVSGLQSAFNTAVLGVSNFYGTLADLASKSAKALGADELSAELDGVAASMEATAAKYSEKIRENNEDVKASFKALTGDILTETQKAADGAAENLSKVAELTGDALKTAVDEAAKQTERLKSELGSVETEVAAAINATQSAWSAYYDASGQAQADALIALNEAIKNENELRQNAASTAITYNNQVGESEKLVTKLATEKLAEQTKAAEAARGELDRLGVDTGLAFDKISTAAKNSISSLDDVVDNIEKIGGTSEQSGAAFQQAFKKALAEVSTAEEFAAIEEKVRSLFAEDKIDSAALQSSLGQIQERITEISGISLEGPGESLKQGMDDAGKSVDSVSGKLDVLADKQVAQNQRLESMGNGISGVINNLAANARALGQAASDAFSSLQFGTPETLEGIDLYSSKLQQASARVNELASSQSLIRNNSLAEYFTDVALNAAEVEKRFYGQKVALDSLLRSVDAGGMSMRQLEYASSSAAEKFDLLDDADLSGLRSAIDATIARIQSLNDAAEDTLSNLKQQLAELRGDTEEAAAIANDQAIANLQAQLEAAREAGADDAVKQYEAAIKAQKEIQALQEKQRKAAARERKEQREEDERRKKERDAAKNNTRATAPAVQQRQSTTPTQTIVLQGPAGNNVSIQTSDPDALLAVLEQAGLRSAAR